MSKNIFDAAFNWNIREKKTQINKENQRVSKPHNGINKKLSMKINKSVKNKATTDPINLRETLYSEKFFKKKTENKQALNENEFSLPLIKSQMYLIY